MARAQNAEISPLILCGRLVNDVNWLHSSWPPLSTRIYIPQLIEPLEFPNWEGSSSFPGGYTCPSA
jgi:hypothetical protein